MHHRFAPEAFPVLQTEDAAAGLVADGTFGTHGQVPLEPLVGHGHPVFVFYDVLPDGGQSCPLAVVYGPHRAPLVSLEFTHFTGQAVGGDSGQTLAAHVTEGGAGVGAGVPVVHP